ncbi:AraC family transcriptional regulator [Dyadobacter sp. MSC1_007]|jgi:AraC-like DNA-binding protein|uniref:AraC family transcriptional regulator n=1 Tax=Dyadobacter sp. MSC1_007 TaxID=2909264 RepID=UPI00202E5767|nr:AraC family transcriptional regulator [Dyadobacter sp. MSC1_007]
MEEIKKYPLGQLFGRPFEKKDFVILDSQDIFRLINDDANSHVQQYHQHDFYTLSWLESGQLLQKLDGKTFTLSKGDIFVACPGQVHENEFGQEAHQVEGGAILFSPELLQQIKHQAAISELTFLDNVFSNPRLSLPDEELETVLSINAILFREMEKRLPNLAMVKSLLSAVLLSIQQTIDNSIIQANSARHIEVYKKFKHLLELHFKENKTPAFYSERLHMSDRHLNRLLKEATTKTAADIILGRSVLEARRLLCFTEMNISEIAWSLGYQDPSYFTKLFKKATGQTPQAYRLSMS